MTLSSVALGGFLDQTPNYMLLSYGLCTILHSLNENEFVLLQDFIFHFVSLCKAFKKNLKIYLVILAKQLYINQAVLCFTESILDLIKTTHFCILRPTTQKSDWHFQSLGRDQCMPFIHNINVRIGLDH